MRIALCTDTFLPIVDGVGRVVYHYADLLACRGHQVYVLCPQYNAGYRGQYPFEIVDYAGVPVPGRAQYAAGIPAIDRHYHNRLKSIELDLIHAHSPGPSGLHGLHLAKKRRVPLIGTFHSKYYEDFYRATHSKKLAGLGTHFVAGFYAKCREVWAVSRSAGETLFSYGYTGSIVHMENGTELCEIPTDPGALLMPLRLPEKPMLLYVGQIDNKKNLPMVLDACALAARQADFILVLAGQGQDSAALTKQAHRLGLADRVFFIGHVNDAALLRALYARAVLFVFPSLYDTAGLVVREAAMMGTASVVVHGSAAAESVIHRVNGYHCQNHAQSLSDALIAALQNPPQAKALGMAARRTIPILWENVIDKVINRYSRLVYEN
ncbi:MAG: glycosyltransferase [Clostridia bacterium]|nr:glycosyltransferase [Clostridia bacterium]